MPSFSPLIFSPRPSIVSNILLSDGRQHKDMSNEIQYSYAVSTDGIEVHQPREERNSNLAQEIDYRIEPLSLLPRIEEIINDPTPSESLALIPDAKGENNSALPLSMRRGRPVPKLSLKIDVASCPSNEDTTSGKSQKTPLNSPPVPDKEKYEIIKTIGNDSEGPCTLVRSQKDRQLQVVKSVRHPILVHGKPIEAKILHHVFPEHHDNIIRLHAYDFIDQLDLVQYDFEYCTGGDLHDLLRIYDEHNTHFPELFIWKVFLELSSALEFLHRGFDPKITDRPGIVHRDIKPPNIFLRRSQQTTAYPDAVIADFGSASFDFATYEPAGTFSWQPPEIPRKTPKGDVWSLGAIIHTMIHSEAPLLEFPEDWEPTDANYEIWELKPEIRQPRQETPEMYSQELVDMMFVALELDHNKRASSSRLLKALDVAMEKQHPPNTAFVTSPQPLEPWAFDRLHNREPSSGSNEVETQDTGNQQYYQMMERLCRSSTMPSTASIDRTF